MEKRWKRVEYVLMVIEKGSYKDDEIKDVIISRGRFKKKYSRRHMHSSERERESIQMGVWSHHNPFFLLFFISLRILCMRAHLKETKS